MPVKPVTVILLATVFRSEIDYWLLVSKGFKVPEIGTYPIIQVFD